MEEKHHKLIVFIVLILVLIVVVILGVVAIRGKKVETTIPHDQVEKSLRQTLIDESSAQSSSSIDDPAVVRLNESATAQGQSGGGSREALVQASSAM